MEKNFTQDWNAQYTNHIREYLHDNEPNVAMLNLFVDATYAIDYWRLSWALEHDERVRLEEKLKWSEKKLENANELWNEVEDSQNKNLLGC